MLRTLFFLLLFTSALSTISAQSLLIAHRGGVVNDTLSENSFAALEEAIRRGYTHVEVDARMTADGHLVCFHNDDLQEEAGRDGKISEMNWDKVKEVVLTRSKEKIPSFDAYCSRVAGRIGLMVDIKGCPEAQVDKFVAQLEAALSKHGLLKDALLLINKTPKNHQSEIVRPFLGKARISWRKSLSDTREETAYNLNFAQEYYIFNHGEDFTRASVKEFQAIGVPVIVSINTGHYDSDSQAKGEAHVREMMEYGVDGLQIDACYDPVVFEKLKK